MKGGDDELDLFAVSAPGIEEIVAGELRSMGIRGRVEQGGVAWRDNRNGLYAATLRLRTASRVLVRIGSFRARTFFELERHSDRIDWGAYLGEAGGATLRVTTRKSRLYHKRAIEERICRSIEQVVGVPVRPVGESDENDLEMPAGQLFVVRFTRDECTISVDASGELLHRRGYRQAVARAPLRETLAAAMLIAAGWTPDRPLLDPFCGSGTILIEAALIARGVPPGLAAANRAPRRYAFQDWRGFEPEIWHRAVELAASGIRDDGPPLLLQGSDRDAGAIEATRSNAARAGVAGDLLLHVHPLSAVEPPARPGWLVTNPPYGVRASGGRDVRNLYAAFGQLARERLEGWALAILSADPAMDRQTGLELRELFRTSNGGIPVRLMAGKA